MPDDNDRTLLIDTEGNIDEQHNDPPTTTVGDAPPPYNDAPPPYDDNTTNMAFPPNVITHAQTVGVMGEPTVVCRVCQQLVFIRGREGQRVVKCSSCHEATPIKAPPTGKKYIRCPCNALLTCRATSSRISCPRANCKRVINVGHPTANNPAQGGDGTRVSTDRQIRVTCGHCNEAFVFRSTSHLARCPYCRNVSSVGSGYARNRAIVFAVIGVIFLAIGVGVTICTYKLARESGGIYVTWFGAFAVGVLNLMRCCYYCTMTSSEVEPDVDA